MLSYVGPFLASLAETACRLALLIAQRGKRFVDEVRVTFIVSWCTKFAGLRGSLPLFICQHVYPNPRIRGGSFPYRI